MKIRIFDIENWKEIGATLSRNKTRTFLTGFGIFWGTFMLAVLLGGARGAEDLIKRNFEGFATNSAFFSSNATSIPYKGIAKGRTWMMDIVDIERIIDNIPELDAVTCIYNTYPITFRNGKYSYSGTVTGADSKYSHIITPKLYYGRFIQEADNSKLSKVAVVGKKVANELFPTQENPLGEIIQVNGISYTVVGVAGQTSEIHINGSIDEMVLIPSATYRHVFNRGNDVDFVMIAAKNGEKIADIIPTIKQIIYSRHSIAPNDPQALWCFDISEQFSMVANLFTGLSLLAFFIGFSTLLAGAIGVGNIMWIIVKERTQEIGIRRALGAKPIDIITQVLSEGVLLTCVAGMGGISFATIALAIAQKLTTEGDSVPGFQMPPGAALSIIIVFVVLGTLAGIIPSLKAMKIKPIEALNDK